eukprot:s424_g18.t1
MASRLAVCVRPWPAGRLPLARVSHGQCRQVAWPYMVQMRGALSSSADSEVTTDATFRYSSFSWRTSAGERYPYEYIVAQQPAGGGTARNALVALEESLPGPASGWSMVLLPSVSLVCSGKEEMRPLATLLSQRGHRCYILEWPGWTQHVQTNWALERCKTEHLAEEYQDFWCQALEHVAQRELAEAKSEAKARKLCIVAAGSASVYALRAVKALQDFVQKEKSQAIPELRYDSLVMLAPSWRAERRQGLLSRLSPDRAAYWMGALLHTDSRVGRIFRRSYFGKKNLQRHFLHAGAPDGNEERLLQLASWFFQRPRPYAQTDAAIAYGFLDPPGIDSVDGLAAEIITQPFRRRVLLLSPESQSGTQSSLWTALEAGLQSTNSVEHRFIPSKSPLPHEVATSAVQFAVDQWLQENSSADTATPLP